jgi:hypothetical protein
MRALGTGLLMAVCTALAIGVTPASGAASKYEVRNCHLEFSGNGVKITRIKANEIAGCNHATHVAVAFVAEKTCVDKVHGSNFCNFTHHHDHWFCENSWSPQTHHHSHCDTAGGGEIKYVWRRPH